jgi:hypothetical protein
MEKVSILTVTQYSRTKSFELLIENIKNQTYKNIIEWIIIEGSQTPEEGHRNQEIINMLARHINLKINYIPYISVLKYDVLKSIALDNAIGDIFVTMDDDDYYFPTYIEHCVNKLSNSSHNAAGTKTIFIHDFNINSSFRCNIVHHIYAYKKDVKVTKNISSYEELVCEQLLVKFVHNSNTQFEKEITLSTQIPKLHPKVIEMLIPENIFNKYKQIFVVNKGDLGYDIVYLTGGHSIEWNPKDMKLGGSEQAVVQLSEEWVKSGKKVAVYGKFPNEEKHNGVEYLKWTSFPYNKKIKVLIAWRTPGILLLMNTEFKAEKLIVDFHDNFSYTISNLDQKLLLKFFEKVDKFNFKSKYHQDCFEETYKISKDKFNIITNGVRVDSFLNNNKLLERNPYRFCYCSSYDRGLEPVLQKIWGKIYAAQPLAELHVYYGMDYIFDQNFKNKLLLLMGQPGVMDHGRQPMEMIIREKYLSTFHLYINNSVAEIDCISIKESLVTGCIPILSNFGVYNERDGIHLPWEPENDTLCDIIAEEIINKMNDTRFVEDEREKCKKSDTIIRWSVIAKKWLETI